MAFTNDINEVRVTNLDPTNGRHGPFIVVQSGVDPEDPSQIEQNYMLKKNGHWVEQIALMALPPKEQEEAFFDSLSEIIKLGQSLPANPQFDRIKAPPEKAVQLFADIEAAGGVVNYVRSQMSKRKVRKMAEAH